MQKSIRQTISIIEYRIREKRKMSETETKKENKEKQKATTETLENKSSRLDGDIIPH